MLCPIKGSSNTIELTVHTSCYWFLDLLCVKYVKMKASKIKNFNIIQFKGTKQKIA